MGNLLNVVNNAFLVVFAGNTDYTCILGKAEECGSIRVGQRLRLDRRRGTTPSAASILATGMPGVWPFLSCCARDPTGAN
jgi:hypothetical protein